MYAGMHYIVSQILFKGSLQQPGQDRILHVIFGKAAAIHERASSGTFSRHRVHLPGIGQVYSHIFQLLSGIRLFVKIAADAVDGDFGQ